MPNDTGDWYDNALARLLGLSHPGATGPGRSDWLSQLAASQQAERDRQRRQGDAYFADMLKACAQAYGDSYSGTDSSTPTVKLPSPLSAPWVTPAAVDSPPVPPRRATDDDEFLRELGIAP